MKESDRFSTAMMFICIGLFFSVLIFSLLLGSEAMNHEETQKQFYITIACDWNEECFNIAINRIDTWYKEHAVKMI